MICSYPTYEEWKQAFSPKFKKCSIGSYPTYEEWKQYNKFGFNCRLYGSYPTYEEWKLRNGDFINTNLNVLILPMRNGNILFDINFTFSMYKFLSYL